MILIITKDLKAECEFTKEITSILEDYSVYHKINENEVHIPPQKVILSEIDMNHLFSDIFIYFTYLLRYGEIGGDGCDFSLELF